jgi:hypothetical protein
LAYAVTITSLQGLEFDFLIFDLSDIGDWLKHALYMGITRVRSPSGIWCLNVPDNGMSFNKNDIDTRDHYERLKVISDKQMALEECRKENFVTVDLVQVLENFKVLFMHIIFFYFISFNLYFLFFFLMLTFFITI